MDRAKLQSTAQALVAPGKGILAADESTGTIKKRFDAVQVESNEENRRAYRDMLLTTPEIEQFISGVILYDETIRQTARAGMPFPNLLAHRGILPGIKVDESAREMAGFPGEKITEGLDGLRDRLKEYGELGAQFAKWRAVITVGDGLPTRTCIEANAEALARYAALCQESGLVPIVEPEVLMDGPHSLERCEEVTGETLLAVFTRLAKHRVFLEGMLLKPNMVLAGTVSGTTASPSEVAEATVRTLLRTVPAAVPGIAFLSGGQSPEVATENLSAINAIGSLPWQLSFSFGRALQEPSLAAWAGKQVNVAVAQRLFFHRARCSSAARDGTYTRQMEAAMA